MNFTVLIRFNTAPIDPRAAGSRRHIDRAMMNGEWPVLLKVMGKNAGRERYLSVEEVRALFAGRRLPERIRRRLQGRRRHECPEPAVMSVSAAERGKLSQEDGKNAHAGPA